MFSLGVLIVMIVILLLLAVWQYSSVKVNRGKARANINLANTLIAKLDRTFPYWKRIYNDKQFGFILRRVKVSPDRSDRVYHHITSKGGFK